MSAGVLTTKSTKYSQGAQRVSRRRARAKGKRRKDDRAKMLDIRHEILDVRFPDIRYQTFLEPRTKNQEPRTRKQDFRL